MKSINKREEKKIAVMAAIIVGFMVIAFMPFASATVTSFSVTPSTGLVGAVDSYNVLVTTTGVTSIEITIPAGFIAVAPTTGGVLIAEVNFWNTSTKTYYGSATITSNDTDPTPTVDVDGKFQVGGDEFAYTATAVDVDYSPGGFTSLEVKVNDGTAWANITLPTETEDGCINITTDCGSLDLLEDVHIAIGQFVRNPLTACGYRFFADGVMEVVTITNPLVYPTVFKNGQWFVDSDGDLIADIWFLYDGSADANTIPLVGDICGIGDINNIIYNSGLWKVDTNHDRVTDYSFSYGGIGGRALVGDVNQDGKDDIAVVREDGLWFVNTTYVPGDAIPPKADLIFVYGGIGSTPLIGDVDQDGKDDIAAVTDSAWYVDTTYDPEEITPLADLMFLYGAPDTNPLIGDADQDGKDDVVIFSNGWWFVDTNKSHIVNLQFLYGTTDMIPLVGAIR